MTTEEKDIYAIGEVPPLGYIPKKKKETLDLYNLHYRS